MIKCPECETEVTTPVKSWAFPLRKPPGSEAKPRLSVSIFQCPNCGARFRSAAVTEEESEEKASIKNMVARIRGVRGELVATLRNLREKMKTLETEHSEAMVEIDNLKKAAETRIAALEQEVDMMREEVKSLKELLDYSGEKQEE